MALAQVAHAGTQPSDLPDCILIELTESLKELSRLDTGITVWAGEAVTE